MENQNKNLLLATVLSFLVILVWFVLFPPPEPTVDPNAPAAVAQTEAAPAEPAATTEGAATTAEAEPLPEAPRLTVDTPALTGSISLLGGRIDQLAALVAHVVHRGAHGVHGEQVVGGGHQH